MCGNTGCHIERNAEFPGQNASTKPVYVTAIERKRAAAQYVEYYTETLKYANVQHTETHKILVKLKTAVNLKPSALQQRQQKAYMKTQRQCCKK